MRVRWRAGKVVPIMLALVVLLDFMVVRVCLLYVIACVFVRLMA